MTPVFRRPRTSSECKTGLVKPAKAAAGLLRPAEEDLLSGSSAARVEEPATRDLQGEEHLTKVIKEEEEVIRKEDTRVRQEDTGDGEEEIEASCRGGLSLPGKKL